MIGFCNRNSCGFVGARSTERSGVVTALIRHAACATGPSRLSQDDLVEIENRTLDTRGNHPVSRFHDAAEARSKTTGHPPLHRDLHLRSAIDAQWLENGSPGARPPG